MAAQVGLAKWIGDCFTRLGLRRIQIVGGSNERGGGGHVLVFANPGDEARTACLRAFPSRTRNWVQASSAGSEDECVKTGVSTALLASCEISPVRHQSDREDFCEEFEEPEEEEFIRNQLRQVSRLMAERLLIFDFNSGMTMCVGSSDLRKLLQ